MIQTKHSFTTPEPFRQHTVLRSVNMIETESSMIKVTEYMPQVTVDGTVTSSIITVQATGAAPVHEQGPGAGKGQVRALQPATGRGGLKKGNNPQGGGGCVNHSASLNIYWD